MRTTDNIADFFTKPMKSASQFHAFPPNPQRSERSPRRLECTGSQRVPSARCGAVLVVHSVSRLPSPIPTCSGVFLKSQPRTGHTREPDPKHNALKHTTTRKTATHERGTPRRTQPRRTSRRHAHTHTHLPPHSLSHPHARAHLPWAPRRSCSSQRVRFTMLMRSSNSSTCRDPVRSTTVNTSFSSY